MKENFENGIKLLKSLAKLKDNKMDYIYKELARLEVKKILR